MNLNSDACQFSFSQQHHNSTHNRKTCEKKASTMTAVLKDFYSENIENLTVLDIGPSTGIIANLLSKKFGKVVGIDIDGPAVEYAANQVRGRNISFSVGDSMNLAFKGDQFDVCHLSPSIRTRSECRTAVTGDTSCAQTRRGMLFRRRQPDYVDGTALSTAFSIYFTRSSGKSLFASSR
jgi:hypothetical protein